MSNTFAIPGWAAAAQDTIGNGIVCCTSLLYVVPARAQGRRETTPTLPSAPEGHRGRLVVAGGMAERSKAAVLKTETRLSAILGFPHKSHTLKHMAGRPTWLPVALEAPFGRAAGTIVGTAVPCTRRRCHAFALVPTLDDIRPVTLARRRIGDEPAVQPHELNPIAARAVFWRLSRCLRIHSADRRGDLGPAADGRKASW